MAGILPIQKSEIKGHFTAPGGLQIKKENGNFFYFDSDNGLTYGIHSLPGENILENYTSDYEKIPWYEIFFVLVLLFSLILILIYGILQCFLSIIRAIKRGHWTPYEKINRLNLLFSSIGSLLFFYSWLSLATNDPNTIKILSLLYTSLSLISMVCLLYQIYNRQKKKNKRSDLFESLFLQGPAIALIFFQFYRFWP